MTKYVINTVEIVKRIYVVDAYTEKEALDKHLDQAPDKVEFIGELTYSVETINEHEYNQEWKPQPDYNEGHDLLSKVTATPSDQLEIFELEPDLWRDD